MALPYRHTHDVGEPKKDGYCTVRVAVDIPGYATLGITGELDAIGLRKHPALERDFARQLAHEAYRQATRPNSPLDRPHVLNIHESLQRHAQALDLVFKSLESPPSFKTKALRKLRKTLSWFKEAIETVGILSLATVVYLVYGAVVVAVPGAIVFFVVYLARLAWTLAG